MVDLIIKHALAGPGQEQAFFCPGNSHIAQPPFFLHALLVHQATSRGKDSLFHACNKYIGELQSFGAVQGHQSNILLFFLCLVQFSNQGNVFQIVLQGSVFGLTVEFLHRPQKLLNVLHAAAGFVGILLLILFHEPGLIHHLLDERTQRHGVFHGH